MSETITIREVDQQKTLSNLDKLKTKKQGGGYAYWVPEEDVQTTTKHITKNGTYKAKNDGKYAYSEVTVNVRGAAGSSNSSGKPSGSDVTTTKPGGGLDLDGVTPPGGSGSSVVGTDPTTGNDVAVGVDSNGNLVQTPVPSAIQIVTPPTKTSYVYQETMDYTGIVVAAKKKDGTTFTDARYMNGHIPMQELIFPVTEAPAGSGGGAHASSSLIEYPVPLVSSAMGTIVELKSHDNVQFILGVTNPNVAMCAYIKQSDVSEVGGRAIFATEEYKTVECDVTSFYPAHETTYTTHASKSTLSSYTYNGKTVYYCIQGLNTHTEYAEISYSLEVLPEQDPGKIAWTMIFGDITGGTATIPVQWLNPYTGDTHQDTFQITSTPSSGSSSTEDDEGGGAGHSF